MMQWIAYNSLVEVTLHIILHTRVYLG